MKKILSIIILLFFCSAFLLFPVNVKAETNPPQALQDLMQEAADHFNTPYGVLEAVAYIEGGHMWNFSDQEILEYSKPGGQDPVNCQPNICGARGPMQFLTGEGVDCQKCGQVCLGNGQYVSTWDSWKNSSPNQNPHPCNIKDALYAASAKLFSNSGADNNQWTEAEIRKAAAGYYGRCHDCSANPEYADCVRLGMSYCDFTVQWMQGNINTDNFSSPNTSSLQIDLSQIDCIASGLADYIAPVFDQLGTEGTGNIKFLTPVFNLTNDNFTEFSSLLETALSAKGYSLSNFAYTAGNAYNTSWGSITDFVNTAKNSPAGSNPIILTESGWFPHQTSNRTEAIEDLRTQLDLADIEAGLIFNVFGNNDQFDEQALYDDDNDSSELESLCQGKNCRDQNIGANSAVYYYNSSSFYDKSSEFKMAYTLEIANAGDVNTTVKQGIEASSGIPIIRIGVMEDGGGFENPQALIDFINTIKNYTSKTVYIIIGPNEPLSELWATPDCKQELSEQGQTIGGKSQVCSDFVEERGSLHDKEPKRIPVSISPGSISLLSVKFPDFKRASKNLANALHRTLPLEKAVNLSLPGSTTLYFKHFAVPQTEGGSFDHSKMTECGQTPESEVEVPSSLWGKMAGAIRGLCTFIGDFPGICPSVEEYQFQLADSGYSCGTGSCAPGQQTKEYLLKAKSNPKTDFHLNSWADQTTKTTSEEIPGPSGFPQIITKTETKTKKEVKFLSRSGLSGGTETAQNANFFHSFLPLDVIKKITPKDEARALEEGFRYDVQFSPVEEGEHQGEYYDLRKIRNFYCMHLCTLYPADINIKDIDPICTSCDPDDYDWVPPTGPIPEPDNLPQYCNWDTWVGGCDYYDPDFCQNHPDFCSQNPELCSSAGGECNECSLCESCLCLPGSLPPPGYFFDAEGADLCLGKCHWEQNEKNKDGGYGECYYKNPNVCKHGSGCADICNAGCCPGD